MISIQSSIWQKSFLIQQIYAHIYTKFCESHTVSWSPWRLSKIFSRNNQMPFQSRLRKMKMNNENGRTRAGVSGKKNTHTHSQRTNKVEWVKISKCVCESFSKLKNHLKHITAYIFAIAKDIVFATAMKIDNWRTHIQSLVLNVAVGKTQCSTSDVFSIRCLNRFFGKSFFHSTKYKVYLSNEFSDRK